MAIISNSPMVKATRGLRISDFTMRISSLILSLLILSTNAAPTSNGKEDSRLVFWFEHDGNHQHEYSSHSDIVCDQIPEQVGRNWASLTVLLDNGGAKASNDISPNEKCAVLFHHSNCIDPVLSLDSTSPQSSLPRAVKSFRYCHSSCEKCSSGNEIMDSLAKSGPSSPTLSPDYDAGNKK